ncbi:hypothetical protein CkaCkLH20_11142 [Colletotrichum karsti]|uniref:Uncharacterized protein n=1 Tax=Colletotrichum karsti TaxID=1095194 RepID=A0A9P6I3Y5_9PEZI|nr:uncharacterized protein CkaCkLH20_11142 [Colletotrichum karsti]KAF9871495.1 hypothetical protein CkaCkLH20_11142 [Colletotrichum karsti]
MPWRATTNNPEGVDMVNPNYNHPQLVLVNDDSPLPSYTATGFSLLFIGGKLFSGKDFTQPRSFEDDEKGLFFSPYTEWAPEPYNNSQSRFDNAMFRIISSVGGMGNLFNDFSSPGTKCDRDLHHTKTRLLNGLPPMSMTRWRQRGLDEPANFERACQHLCQVVDAFEYLNLPHSHYRRLKTHNEVWEACSNFQNALNEYRRRRFRGPVSVTALWEEYMVDYLQTVAARAHSWTLARIDELREVQLERLSRTTGATDGSLPSPEQMEILDRIHDLTGLTNQADTKIMLHTSGFRLQTLTSAVARIKEDWNGYAGEQPMTSFPSDMRLRSKIYGMRCKFLSHQHIMNRLRSGTRPGEPSDPASLGEQCRSQVSQYKQARSELRGPPPQLGDEPWVAQVRLMLTMANRPVRIWGFVGYRICYEHSDEEWKSFLDKFRKSVTVWGEGVDGAQSLKPMCKVRWLDGREHGIPEGDVEAAKQHYKDYIKTPACEGFVPMAEQIFLVADKASIESHINPVEDNAEPVIPRGDLGSFILTARAPFPEDDVRGQRRGGQDGQDEFDGTLRVLGSVLFDDFFALQTRHAVRLQELARMAKVHPRQVYVGPSVPMEREGWRDSGTWALTVLKSFEKWRGS